MKDWKSKSKQALRSYRVNISIPVYEKSLSYLEEILWNEKVSPEIASHCYARIFPLIALYKAIKEQNPTLAYKQVSECFWTKQVIPGSIWMQRLLRIPGIYKLIPRLTVCTVKKKYKASVDGFQYNFLETSQSCVRLTFHQCPYYNYCAKYGVPELCDVFCTSDEIVAKYMSPYILFNRTQTIGRGGTCCDFTYEINPQVPKKHIGNPKKQ